MGSIEPPTPLNNVVGSKRLRSVRINPLRTVVFFFNLARGYLSIPLEVIKVHSRKLVTFPKV